MIATQCAAGPAAWPGAVINAIVVIDLAQDKQMVVVCDPDSMVLARRTFRCRAWDLGRALGWAARCVASKGFAGATVACEPTGHQWRVLGELAAARGMAFVCVQPSVTSYSRRSEDLTPGKTDEKDAVLIARLTAQLRCYEPEPVHETWARLRHLGVRREQLITVTSSQVQQMRDLLDCVCPAVLDAAQQPVRSQTWLAALTVVVDRDAGDLARTGRLGWGRFETAVRRQITWQGRPETVPAHRSSDLRNADRQGRDGRAPGRRAGTSRAAGRGLAPSPARRSSPARAAPDSGSPHGARSGAQRANPVYAARHAHLTGREHNRLKPTQAQTVIAAAILRHLHSVITTGRRRDPMIATDGTRAARATPTAA